MKKGFLKCAVTLISLATASAVIAATNTNPNNSAGSVGGTINQGVNNTLGNIGGAVGTNVSADLANTKATLKSQGVNMQNATNSLIAWLNANLVNGIPPGFSKSMKGNWQIILANYSLSDLNWLLTQKFTFALLSGVDISTVDDDVPTTTMTLSEIKSKVGHFNIGSLLSTTTISPKSDEEKNAQVLLQFVSGLNNAVSALPSKIVSRGLGSVNQFQNQFGTYLAQQSVGLNALYNLLNERLVKKGLGAQLGGSQTDMSPLGLDEYMATRRLDVNDPNGWLSQLSTATPAQMSKEQLMLLAEMRYEMFLTRQTLEQMTTLMAVQQLQLNSADAVKLQQIKNNILSASTSSVLQ